MKAVTDASVHKAMKDLAAAWAKFTTKDFEDAVLKRAFASGKLLDSVHQAPIVRTMGKESFEIIFTHMLHGAFVDMGAGRHGIGTFKPRKWYARNWSYSVHRLSVFMMRRYGKLGAARVLEAFPDKIKM